MRLLATFAAVATVNAFLDDNDILQRSRRSDGDVDDEGCPDGTFPTVGGFCTDDEALATDIANAVIDADEEESSSAAGGVRKFPMGSQGSNPFFGGDEGGLERTKRRSQRMTLLLAKVTLGGSLLDADGKKIRSKEFIKRVNEYGCHCWPSQTKEHLTGLGKPLDDVDESCWELRKCHKCIDIDYPERCDPVTTKYKAKISRDGSNGLSIMCTNTLNGKGTNNGDCKKSLCECDKAFADSFSTSFGTWDASVWKLNEKEEYSSLCQRPQSHSQRLLGSGPDSCCGTYPDVKAYNSATHSCIDGVVSSDNL